MTIRASTITRTLALMSLFGLALRCTSIPNTDNILPAGDGGPLGGNGGSSAGGSGGSGTGGRAGSGGRGNGGITGSGGIIGGGGSGMGGSGGIGGGGTGGIGGTGGTVGGLKCGNATCRNSSACCATDPAGQQQCGFDVGTLAAGVTGCVPLDQPGTPDATCPDQTVAGQTLKGCCRPDGSCGATANLLNLNLGCVNPTQVGLPAGPNCQTTCAAQGASCSLNSDCCDVPTGAACATLGATAACTAFCKANTDCTTGCCVLLVSGRGACGDSSLCPTGCAKQDDTCSTDADCCSPSICVAQYPLGPRLCRPACQTNADCGTGLCIKDATTAKSACSRPGAGLCTDTCLGAKDGQCQDGGKGSSTAICALGSDCTDCGPRLGGAELCSEDCGTSKNGVCEDGGTHSTSATCSWGSDCTDCGPRSSICTDDCSFAKDGTCDYDGVCAPGTDCTDCGPFYGGRGEGICDGTAGTVCTERVGVSASFSSFQKDGLCECSDCPWDAVDCASTTNLCDGKSISACCDPSNPCGFDADGVCDCGGWCTWEVADCGGTGTTPGMP